MDIGVTMFSTDYSMRIDDLAREVEARGFESLLVPEHTHIPTSRRSPFGGGAELPKEYWHTVDPFVGLMAAAAVTKKLKVGTGICLSHRARHHRHGEGGGHASTCCRTAASSRDRRGLERRRRWRTTGPTSSRATGSWASRSPR